jgi:ribonuclease Z
MAANAIVPAHPTVALAQQIVRSYRRVLLYGEPGVGKSTLAAELARMRWVEGRASHCLSADPGSPAFGVPGAVCCGRWDGDRWQLVDLEALCTLDAGRFRLPLVSAVRHLARRAPRELLVDPPGVVRGAAAAEILTALAEATQAEALLVLVHAGGVTPLAHELRALALPVFSLAALPKARRCSQQENARRRTALWNGYLEGAAHHSLRLQETVILGTPPEGGDEAWSGRQVAILGARGETLALGEATEKDGEVLGLSLVGGPPGRAPRLLVRDARRGSDGLLGTFRTSESEGVQYLRPDDLGLPVGVRAPQGPRPSTRLGPVTATLVNGVFGDPLLHIRLRHRKRSLLFDLGDPGRLPARTAHQITDVFISHAHFDHIGGLPWLLRSRIGRFPPCRLFGPPGLAANVEGVVRSVRWDRAGHRAPRFEVGEIHDGRLFAFRVEAGRMGPAPLGERPMQDGVLLDEPGFRVRGVTLDHGTPVLAFALECSRQLHVRKERLAALRLEPGRWLGELRDRLGAGERGAEILLPGGRAMSAGALGDELLLASPGAKLAYAADVADTEENRRRLVEFARDAHTFFCEAAFAESDADRAAATGHLSTRACGEIATAAAVQRLVPFHFSRRYHREAQRIYAEVRAACRRTCIPKNYGSSLD